MSQRSENSTQRNRWRLLAITIGIAPALVAVLIAAVYFCERSPAPLEPRLRKRVHDLRADVPAYYAWIIKLYSTRKATWLPDRLVKRAYAEAERLSDRRGRAGYELCGMGTNAWAAIPALLKALQSRNLEIRYTAAVMLGRIKADQAPEFERLILCLRNQERPADVFGFLLTGPDESGRRHRQDVRCFALTCLTAMGPGARSQLGMMLEILKSKEEDNEIRVKAAEVICSVGSAGDGGVAILKQIFQDPEEWPVVRAGAARALAGAAPDDPQLRSLLRPALRNSPALVRIAAAETLWQLGAPAAEVLPVLAEALGHKLASVRLAALKAVTRMGRAAQPIASAVRALLSDEKEPVRQAATAALASMRSKGDPDYPSPTGKGSRRREAALINSTAPGSERSLSLLTSAPTRRGISQTRSNDGVLFQAEGCVHYYSHWAAEHLKDPGLPYTPTVSNSLNFSLTVSNSCYLLRMIPSKAGAYLYQEAAFDGQTLYFVSTLNLAEVQGTPPAGAKLNVANAWLYGHQRVVHSVFARDMGPVWLMLASGDYFRAVTNGLVEPALTLGLFENADYYPRPFLIPARWELQEAFPYLPLRVVYLDDGETKTEPPFQNAKRDPPLEAGFTNAVFRVTATREFGGVTVPATGEVDTYNLIWVQGKQELRPYTHYLVALTKWSKGTPPTVFKPQLPGLTTINDTRASAAGRASSVLTDKWPLEEREPPR